MYEYEPIIKEEDFKDVHEHSENKERMTINLARSFKDRTAINQTNIQFCSVEKLWLETPGKKGPEDKAVNFPHSPIPADAQNRWHFAPKEETTKIGWELKGRLSSNEDALANPIILKLELFTRNNRQAFWTKTMKWTAGECLKRGETEFNGLLGEDLFKSAHGKTNSTDDVTIRFPVNANFPDGILTVDHSPYKLKLSIVDGGEPRRQVAKWIYIDVLVDSLEINWGEISMLPKVRTDITDPRNFKKIAGHTKDPNIVTDKDIKGYEEIILEELKTANPKPTKDVVHEVKLTSNLFAFQKKQETNKESFEFNTDFLSHKALWGNGARIPLVVKAYIKTSATDGKTDEVPEALGQSKILWDWNEKKVDRWKEPLNAGNAPKTEPFLDEGYKQNNDAKPVALSNCPKEFGGKRGDDSKAANIFPDQVSGGVFPFAVNDCTIRKWASLSSFGTGENRDKSGVIFQPSRMAGDAYMIKAYLHFERDTDSEDDITAPKPIQTDDFLFKVFRRIQLNSLVRGRAKLNTDPNALEATLKTDYLKELDMVVEVKQTDVDNTAYKAALKIAIDRLCNQEHFVDELKDIPYLSLLAKYAIEPDPLPDSAGVVFRDWNHINTKLNDKFENSAIRVVNSLSQGGAFLDEKITGRTSNVTGTLIKVDTRRFVLHPTGGGFTNNEQVEGKSSKTLGNMSVTPNAKSCWGHDFQVIPKTIDDNKIYKESIRLRFHTNNEFLDIKYKKRSVLSTELSTDLSDGAKLEIVAAFGRAWTAHNEANSFDVQIFARDDSPNARLRSQNLKTYLESFFAKDTIVDRKAVWTDVMKKLKTAFIGGNGKKVQKTLALLLVGEITWEYAAQPQFHDEEGIFNLHIPGLYKGYLFPDADSNVATEIKMPIVMGASYPELTGEGNNKPFSTRSRSIVYLATVADAVADKSIPTKTVGSIFKHELAHSLFLPHSPARPAKPFPKSYPQCHVKEDKCLMNYDLDTKYFCGLCMMRIRGWNWKAQVLENRIVKVQIQDGNKDTYLTANAIQNVNLPVEDKWVDGVNIMNKDRLGRKIRVKVEFQQEMKDEDVTLHLLAHKDNTVYSVAEATRNPNYNIVKVTADKPLGDFDKKQKILKGKTDEYGNFYAEFELSPAVGDRYKVIAWDKDDNRVQSVEITTWRTLYYMVISAGATAQTVPLANFRGGLETAYTAEFTRLIHLGDETMAQLHPIQAHQYIDPISPIDFAHLVEAKCNAVTTNFPGKRYVDFIPYLARFAFTDQLASSISNKPTLPVAAPIGVGNPVVRVPVKLSNPTEENPTADMRKGLWIGFGKSIMDGNKETVPGNNWFISASVKFPDGTINLIPVANCTPVVDALRPGLYKDVDVRVDNLPAHQPNGEISLEVIVINRMVLGMARPGNSRGIIILPCRAHFEVKTHANQISAGIHELGHALGMVAEPNEIEAKGGTGLDKHDTWYKSDGGHCWTGLTKKAKDADYQKDPNASANAQCVMFGFIANPPRHTFCANCQKVFKKIDASKGLL